MIKTPYGIDVKYIFNWTLERGVILTSHAEALDLWGKYSQTKGVQWLNVTFEDTAKFYLWLIENNQFYNGGS